MEMKLGEGFGVRGMHQQQADLGCFGYDCRFQSDEPHCSKLCGSPAQTLNPTLSRDLPLELVRQHRARTAGTEDRSEARRVDGHAL